MVRFKKPHIQNVMTWLLWGQVDLYFSQLPVLSYMSAWEEKERLGQWVTLHLRPILTPVTSDHMVTQLVSSTGNVLGFLEYGSNTYTSMGTCQQMLNSSLQHSVYLQTIIHRSTGSTPQSFVACAHLTTPLVKFSPKPTLVLNSSHVSLTWIK
jgi:hypothetical protein